MAGKGSYTKFGANLADLEAASRCRLSDAKTLATAGNTASAIAAGLYALEICLKARICKRLDLPSLPNAFEIHELDSLLVLSGLSQAIEETAWKQVRLHWGEILVLAASVNELRYLPEGSPRLPANARTSADAWTFLERLEHPQDGVLTWLLSRP